MPNTDGSDRLQRPTKQPTVKRIGPRPGHGKVARIRTGGRSPHKKG
jgi:hypothetical protein